MIKPRQRIADGRTHMRHVTASTRSLWPRVSTQITAASAHQKLTPGRLAAGSHDQPELAVQAPEEQACITGQHGFFLVVIEEVESLDDRS